MIFAHPPMKTRLSDGTVSHTVCTVFKNRNKSISISLDDSCGRMTKLRRSDMRLFIEDIEGIMQEVTHRIFFTTITRDAAQNIDASLENFQLAWEWLNE